MVNCKKNKMLILSIFTVAVFFSFLRAQGVSQESTTSQQNSQSTQKEAPVITIQKPRIEIVPAPSTSEPQGTTSKEDTSSAKHPHITIDSPLYDAGEVGEGEEIVHSFIVKNTGEVQLNIKSVDAG